jgi:hypothetical protein
MDLDTHIRRADPALSVSHFNEPELATQILEGLDEPIVSASRSGARHGRVLRVGALATVAASVVAVIGLVGYGRARPAHSPLGSVPTSTTAAPAPAIDFVPYLFTATSAEFNSTEGQAWWDFRQEVSAASENQCLEAQGFTAPADLVPTGPFTGIPYDNTQFPDTQLFLSGSFGPDVAGKGYSPPNSQVAAAQATCRTQAASIFNSIDHEMGPLQNEWANYFESTESSAQTKAAWSLWATCVQAHGVDVSNYNDFFGLADEAQGLPGYPHSAVRVAQLAVIYGTCIPPVVSAFDQQRLADRTVFLAANQAQVSQLESNMNALVTQLSAEFALSYPTGR